MTTPGERQLAQLAAGQHGVVTRAQLLDAGLGAKAIADRVRVGRLHPSAGRLRAGAPPPSPHARAMAAVLGAAPAPC